MDITFAPLVARLPPNTLQYAYAALATLALRDGPWLAGKLFGKAEELALVKGGPSVDAFVLAAVNLAEKAIPAPGSGDAKYEFVARLIKQGIPGLKLSDQELGQLIEKSVEAMQAQADANAAQIAAQAKGAAPQPPEQPK